MARAHLSLRISAKTREVQLECNSLLLVAPRIFVEPFRLIGHASQRKRPGTPGCQGRRCALRQKYQSRCAESAAPRRHFDRRIGSCRSKLIGRSSRTFIENFRKRQTPARGRGRNAAHFVEELRLSDHFRSRTLNVSH